MRNLLYMLFTVAILSCNNSSNSKLNTADELKRAIAESEKSPIMEKNLFLGFKFGMTEKELGEHATKLVEDNKLRHNDRNELVYDFNLDTGVSETTIIPYVRDGLLYKIEFELTPIGLGSVSHAEMTMLMALNAFREANLGKGFKSYLETIAGYDNYYFIKNNLIVKFSHGGTANMTYINAPVENASLDEYKSNLEESRNSTINDF